MEKHYKNELENCRGFGKKLYLFLKYFQQIRLRSQSHCSPRTGQLICQDGLIDRHVCISILKNQCYCTISQISSLSAPFIFPRWSFRRLHMFSLRPLSTHFCGLRMGLSENDSERNPQYWHRVTACISACLFPTILRTLTLLLWRQLNHLGICQAPSRFFFSYSSFPAVADSEPFSHE